METYYPFWQDGKKIGKITQQFGVYNPRYQQWGFTHHNGIDIAVPVDTEVHGITGIVETIGNDKTGYGVYVVILDESQQCWWTYAHLSHISVIHGQRVTTGDIIGLSGNTGNSTGPHLHVGCRPFNYDRNNGTLGYVEFSWFSHIIVEEQMNAAEYRAVQTRLEYLKTVKFSKGLWLKNDKGTFREMNKDGIVVRSFGTPEELHSAGWEFGDETLTVA